jgi:Ca2+-binding EF-hand superfamily protein
MTQKPYENDTTEDIERIFEYIDEENKGFITPEDLMACAEELHEELTLEEAKEMVRSCDPNSQDVVGLGQFVKFNKRKTFD